MYDQRNAEQFYQAIGAVAGYSYQSTAHYDFIQTTQSRWPNSILNVRGSQEDLLLLFDTIEQRNLLENNLPNLIKCCPKKDNKLLLALAKERNYRTGFWAAMTHSLEELTSLESTKLTIQQVTSKNEIQLWTEIVAKELLADPGMESTVFESMMTMEECIFYLGWLGNKAVAASMLFVKEKVGGVYLVATDSEYRKRGFGAEVTNICLHKAKELQCSRVDIQATDAGKNMYGALGFKDSGRINVMVVD